MAAENDDNKPQSGKNASDELAMLLDHTRHQCAKQRWLTSFRYETSGARTTTGLGTREKMEAAQSGIKAQAGTSVNTTCSNNAVKSKSSRQPTTAGPKLFSLRQDMALATNTGVDSFASTASGGWLARLPWDAPIESDRYRMAER